MSASDHYDVLVIGGGPGGSTVAALVRKYNPDLRVLVLEKEHFPREHVGESQLPSVCSVLYEMGCWDKVEAANFPIKIGASLTWGKTEEPWDFDFFPPEDFVDEPRPGTYEGQRRQTAFQVDRAIYDDILLKHAEELGAEVAQGTRVEDVLHESDHVTGVRTSDGRTITATHYVDASGNVGILRRALGVEVDAPEQLRNIAVWDYWENAEWSIEIGVGATRVLVRSLPYGWIWFIPLGPTRTSIGLICPAAYYRDSGKAPADLYHESIRADPEIARLIQNATPDGETRTTKDWSQVAHRVVGENWFLVGESAGFADPILAAGMALTHAMAREAAYTILELERGEHDPKWLRTRYDEQTRKSIEQHIRFAQYWYSANGQFGDLQEHCASIAKEAGLRLSPQQAWKWLAQGGFVNHGVRTPQFGSFDIFSARRVIERFAGRDQQALIEQFNVLSLNMHGAEESAVGELRDGRIHRVPCLTKNGRSLPLVPPFDNVVKLLEHTDDTNQFLEVLEKSVAGQFPLHQQSAAVQDHMEALETMLHDGWVIGKRDRKRGTVAIDRASGVQLRDHAEGLRAIEEAKRGRT